MCHYTELSIVSLISPIGGGIMEQRDIEDLVFIWDGILRVLNNTLSKGYA